MMCTLAENLTLHKSWRSFRRLPRLLRRDVVSVSRQSRELTTSRSRAISCRWSRGFVRRALSVAQYSRRRPMQTNLP